MSTQPIEHTGKRSRCIWHCPFCDHTLVYSEEQREVVKLAAKSHVKRQHPVSYWANFTPKDLLLNSISNLSETDLMHSLSSCFADKPHMRCG